jgi:hypothetical protein
VLLLVARVVLLLPFVGYDELRSVRGRLGAWRHCQLDALKGSRVSQTETRVSLLNSHTSGQVSKKIQDTGTYCAYLCGTLS